MADFTISGNKVDDANALEGLQKISESEHLRQLHNGDKDFTESELGAILDIAHPEEGVIDGGDSITHTIPEKTGLTEQQFVALAKEYHLRFPAGKRKVDSGLWAPIKFEKSTGAVGQWERQTMFRTVPFESKQVMTQLGKLLGTQFNKAVASKTDFETVHVVKTPHGPLEVKIHYRPEYGDIFFTLSDTQTKGTSLRLDLDEKGSPTKLTSIDDADNIFSGVFSDLGIVDVSKALGPVTAQAYKGRIESINTYEAVTKELQHARGQPERMVSIQTDYYGHDNGIFVNQNEYQVASIDTPLATAGVNTCSALIVIDRVGKRHYLTHIDSSSTPAQIEDSIRANFSSLSRLDVYVMEGITPSGTMQNIYTALKKMGLERKLKFVSFGGIGFPQVGTQNGELFNPTITFQRKSSTRIAK